MKANNIIKVLPVIFLLTGCNTSKEAHSDLPYKKLGENEEITLDKFREISDSLKNNWYDYSDCISTVKVEIVESNGGESKKYLNKLLSLKVDDTDFKFYELGNTYSYSINRIDRIVSNHIMTIDYKYYLFNDKLVYRDIDYADYDPDHFDLYFYNYFDKDGLPEKGEAVYDRTFDDKTNLFIYLTASYEWIK